MNKERFQFILILLGCGDGWQCGSGFTVRRCRTSTSFQENYLQGQDSSKYTKFHIHIYASENESSDTNDTIFPAKIFLLQSNHIIGTSIANRDSALK